jgi:uncharacterized membrane protein YcgQ (UPF0703/DUF1980 family)
MLRGGRRAVIVRVVGVQGVPPPSDQWVIVTGHFHQPDGDTPYLEATGVQQISQPEDPYE